MRSNQLADPAISEQYRQLAEEEVPAMAPMYQLVARLCQKEYAAILPAGTSLDALVIGAEGGDAISVEYLREPRGSKFGGGVFEVCYLHRKTCRLEKHVGDLAMSERVIDSLAMRLIIRARYHEVA